MNTATTDLNDERFGNGQFDEPDNLIDFDLSHIVEILNRNKFWIIGIVAIAGLLGFAASMLMVPRYVASAKVLIEQQADKIIEGGDIESVSDPYDAERFLQTQIDIILSRSLAKRVVTEEKLNEDRQFFAAFGAELPEGGSADEAREFATNLLQGAVSAELPYESRVVPIRVETTVPAYSAKLADAYARNYIESNLVRKFDSSAYARDFLTGELEEARERLEASERDLNQYSREAGLIRLPRSDGNTSQEGSLSVTNDSLVQANSVASDAIAERVAAQKRWQTVAGEPALTIPEVLANNAVQDLFQQKAKVSAELAAERARHLDGHPTVKALKARVGEIDRRLDTIAQSIKRSIYLEFEAARQKEASLSDRVGTLRSSALNEQDRGVQYNVLRRVADTNRSLYETLLERYNELSATAGAASNNIALVDTADLPRMPSSPNIPFNVLVSLLLGTVLAGGFVFVREHFDDVIRAPEDVEAKLGLPMLGLIPIIDGDAREELHDSKTPISEAYHTLVTNLLYSTSTGMPKSLLVTSAAEVQGKTTTATAVALDLARLGRTVLHIDADLRRPTLHRTVEAGNELGLTALLAGQADIDAVLVPGPVSNLSYLTALPVPPEPSLLLGGGRLPDLLDQLKDRFDVLVVDGPPMLGLSDAANLASHVDGVLIMADATQFNRGAVRATVRRLRMVNAAVLGVVVTKFDPSAAGGHYSYYGPNYYQYDQHRAS